jgi:hypothetical protein
MSPPDDYDTTYPPTSLSGWRELGRCGNEMVHVAISLLLEPHKAHKPRNIQRELFA